MVDLKPVTASMVFTNALGWLLNIAGYIEFNFLTSTLLLGGSAVMMIAIGLASTPIGKGGAVLGFAVFFFAYIMSITIPDPTIANVIYGLITLPSVATLGFIFLEVGRA